MAAASDLNVRHLRPPTVTYKPSMWGDIFSKFSCDNKVQEKYNEEIEALKKEARSLLMAATCTKLMVLIDKLERLGLAYHFENEIEENLKQNYTISEEREEEYDLFATSLRFRLLRQHQYHVSCHVFDKFVDKQGKFSESLINEVEGILSLYEAAHVRIRDEDVLDEAASFTLHHLKLMLPKLEGPIKEKVEKALRHPIHRGLPLLNMKSYISLSEREGCTDGFLIKLAKLNFNFLQNIYRKDLVEITRWWDKFDLKTKLPYTRDRVVECFMWGTAHRPEPQYSHVRIAVARNMQLVTIMDDTYDNYATLEEDDLFTEALERWNLDAIDVLPDYMKVVYRFIMSVYDDYVIEAERRGKSFVVPYYRDAVKDLGRAYNREQKWIMERQMPSYDEFMTNSVYTSCIYVMFIAFIPFVKSVTEEDVKWLISEAKLVISTAKMGRTLEDIGSHERENRDGEMPTVVDCYMKDKGVSKEEAISDFWQLVENGWKDMTAEWAKGGGGGAPKEMVEQLLNYGRMAEVTYNNSEDGYTNPEKYYGPLAAALFLDPLPI